MPDFPALVAEARLLTAPRGGRDATAGRRVFRMYHQIRECQAHRKHGRRAAAARSLAFVVAIAEQLGEGLLEGVAVEGAACPPLGLAGAGVEEMDVPA